MITPSTSGGGGITYIVDPRATQTDLLPALESPTP